MGKNVFQKCMFKKCENTFQKCEKCEKEIVEKLDICKSFWNRKRLKNAQSIEHVVNDIKLL